MNIFFLSKNPKEAAIFHNNRHCVKMILESAQLLSTAHRILDGVESEYTKIKYKDDKVIKGKVSKFLNVENNKIYMATHINHPSSVWTRESSAHYDWLFQLFSELCKEYTYRYGKVHKCWSKLSEALKSKPSNIQDKGFTQPPQAMPDIYKDVCSVEAYRKYYIGEKASFCVWTGRPTPFWFSKY